MCISGYRVQIQTFWKLCTLSEPLKRERLLQQPYGMCVQPAPAFTAPKEMWLGFGADICAPEGFRNQGLKEREQKSFQVVFDAVAVLLVMRKRPGWHIACDFRRNMLHFQLLM